MKAYLAYLRTNQIKREKQQKKNNT